MNLLRIAAGCSLLWTALAGPAQGQVSLYRVQAQPGALGAGVDLDAGRVLAGAPFADLGFAQAGAALVIDAVDGTVLHTLTPNDAYAGQRFGYRVDLFGELAVVGAPLDDGQGVDSGAAYLFHADTGAQLFRLEAAGGAAQDQLGQAVAVGEGMVAVGATGSDLQAPGAGAVVVFDAATGAELLTLTVPDGAAGDGFGNALALHGGQLFVGSRRHDEGGANAGSVYVFDLPSGQLQSELRPADSQPGQNFGAALSVDDQYLVVGAIQDPSLVADGGAVYVFERSSLLELHKLTPQQASASSLFGQGLALDGGRVLIGASHEAANDGYVYLFDLASGQQLWRHRSAATSGSLYGVSLGFEGERAVVAAPGHQGSGALFGFLPELDQGQITCPGVPNSTGAAGELSGAGSISASENQLWLRAGELPPNQFGFFLVSATQGFVSGPGQSQGNLCLGGTIGRFNQSISTSGPAGFLLLRVDLTQLPTSPVSAVQAGETWYFQAWYRDQNPQPTSNFTAGVALDFR